MRPDVPSAIVAILLAGGCLCTTDTEVHAQQTYGPTTDGSAGLVTIYAPEPIPPTFFSVVASARRCDWLSMSSDGSTPSRRDGCVNTVTFGVAYGIRENVEIGLDVPLCTLCRPAIIGDAGPLGNIRVGTKWRLWYGGSQGTKQLAVRARLALPSGMNRRGHDSDSPSLDIGFAWSHPGVVANVGFVTPLGGDDGKENTRFDLGLGHIRTLNRAMDAVIEGSTSLQVRSRDGIPPNSASALAGIRYWFGSGRWSASAGIGVVVPFVEPSKTSTQIHISLGMYPSLFDFPGR